jgi:hypothetical protein
VAAPRPSQTASPSRVAIPLAVEVLGEVATRMVTVSERRIAEAVGEYAAAGSGPKARAAALAAVPELDDLGDPLVLSSPAEHRRRALHAGAASTPSSFPD